MAFLLKGESCGAGGRPLVVAHPSSPTAESFMELGAGLVREVAKMQRQERNAVRWIPCSDHARSCRLICQACLLESISGLRSD